MRESIVGNSKTLNLLESIARSESLGHAYLFSGPEGVGKKQAAVRFARLINCTCNSQARCPSCEQIDALNHPELLILEDANEPRWLRRTDIFAELATSGLNDSTYEDIVSGLIEKGLLEAPYPATSELLAIDAFRIVTNNIFGKGSVPSVECYTPVQFSEALRKKYDKGDLTSAEYGLLRMLYEYPLSVMPYRGTIPIAYITGRHGWKFVRPVQKFLSMRSILGGKKIVIIDDAHKMTPEAQNCLLKTLEEPPPDSVLILITAQRELLFETVVSRCQIVTFGRLSASEMDTFLKAVYQGERDDMALLLGLSEGSPRRLLELLTGDVGKKLDAVRDTFDALVGGRGVAAFEFARRILDGAGSHRKRQQEAVGEAFELLIFYLMEVLKRKKGKQLKYWSSTMLDSLSRHAQVVNESSLYEAIDLLGERYHLVSRNVDMATLLQSTMLRMALLVGAF